MKEKKEIAYSRHHIIPTSVGGANVPKNIVLIRDVQHRAIHTLFSNQLLAEQLISTVNISSKALRPEVKERLLETLTAHDADDLEFWYRPECFK